MSVKDRNSIYNQVVFSIALNSISNVFNQDIHNNIDTIVFNGYIKDIDSSHRTRYKSVYNISYGR